MRGSPPQEGHREHCPMDAQRVLREFSQKLVTTLEFYFHRILLCAVIAILMTLHLLWELVISMLLIIDYITLLIIDINIIGINEIFIKPSLNEYNFM